MCRLLFYRSDIEGRLMRLELELQNMKQVQRANVRIETKTQLSEPIINIYSALLAHPSSSLVCVYVCVLLVENDLRCPLVPDGEWSSSSCEYRCESNLDELDVCLNYMVRSWYCNDITTFGNDLSILCITRML